MSGTALITGFTLGAAGSLHCMGMCGPLSLALPVQHLSKLNRSLSILLYQFGRIITYSLIGFVLGLAGRRIYLSGYQQWFSVIAGSVILLLALFYFVQRRGINVPLFNPFYKKVQGIIVRILKSPSGIFSYLLLGMANGLLPCGMVYIALASSLTFPQAGESVAFMAMFGAGTLPAMLMVSYAGMLIKPELRSAFRRAVPVFVSLMGVLLILRGMNLGIPYLSPELPHSPGTEVLCHP